MRPTLMQTKKERVWCPFRQDHFQKKSSFIQGLSCRGAVACLPGTHSGRVLARPGGFGQVVHTDADEGAVGFVERCRPERVVVVAGRREG